MSLQDWISGRVATATPATLATVDHETGRRVAKVTTVAVAEHKKNENGTGQVKTDYPARVATVATVAVAKELKSHSISPPERDFLPVATATLTTSATDQAVKFCTGWRCIRFEEINLPRRGLTPGCIIKNKGGETWRRLDRMTTCPLEN